MFKWLLLLAIPALHAYGQSPQQLLESAQDAYKNPEGYEIRGKGWMLPEGSSTESSGVQFETSVAAEASPFESPRPPAHPGARTGAVKFGPDWKGARTVSFNLIVVASWTRAATDVESVRETGTEELPLNGSPVPCRILEVRYRSTDPDAPPVPATTYSICSDLHLILRKEVKFPTGPHGTGPSATWRIVFDQVEFHRPAPQWLLAMKDLPDLTIRKEWIGRPAPNFKLSDLDGNAVDLASMRGKLVLLDFWSVSCGPCIRQRPMVEEVATAHKDVLTLWGVSFDPASRDKRWFSQHPPILPTLTDADFVTSDSYKVHDIPSLVLIGRDGTIRSFWEGNVGRATLEAAIRNAAKTTPPAKR